MISRLGDSDLSPATVARANHISVRQLHRLFALEGTTFGAFLRGERLRLTRRDLADPAMRTVAIAEIARRRGFPSPAHFTRAFTADFEMGPRAFRQSCLHHSGSSSNS